MLHLKFFSVLVPVILLCQPVPSRFRRIEVVLPSLDACHWSATLVDMLGRQRFAVPIHTPSYCYFALTGIGDHSNLVCAWVCTPTVKSNDWSEARCLPCMITLLRSIHSKWLDHLASQAHYVNTLDGDLSPLVIGDLSNVPQESCILPSAL